MKNRLRSIIEDSSTKAGKIFDYFILFIGIGIVTVPAGLVATALTKARSIEENERDTGD